MYRPYFWPHWPEARAKGSGIGPLPFVTGPPPGPASPAAQREAPTNRRSPFGAPGARWGRGRRRCSHGAPPD